MVVLDEQGNVIASQTVHSGPPDSSEGDGSTMPVLPGDLGGNSTMPELPGGDDSGGSPVPALPADALLIRR